MTDLLLDACVLINLVASGRMVEIGQANDVAFVMARVAAEESLYVDAPGSAASEPIPIDIGAMEAAGEIRLLDLEEQELESFVDMAATIDDGEAATFAIAVHRKLQAATDDRGALRYVEQNEAPIQVVSTSQLLRKWAENNSDPDEIAETLRRIRDGGRFEPSQTDPNYGWWMKMLEEAP